MSNNIRSNIRLLIKELTGKDNVIAVPRAFIKFTGSSDAALLLNQLLYWSERTDDPDGWIYKTAKDWEVELGLSYYKTSRLVTKLKSCGIQSKVKKHNGVPMAHYRVDHDVFEESFVKFLESQETQKSEIQETSISETEETSTSSNTEITSETTTEIKTLVPTGTDEAEKPIVLSSMDQLSPAARETIKELDKELDALDIHDPQFDEKLSSIADQKSDLLDEQRAAIATAAKALSEHQEESVCKQCHRANKHLNRDGLCYSCQAYGPYVEMEGWRTLGRVFDATPNKHIGSSRSGFFVIDDERKCVFLPRFKRRTDADDSELMRTIKKARVVSWDVLTSACGHYTILERIEPKITDRFPQFGDLFVLVHKYCFNGADDKVNRGKAGKTTKALLAAFPDVTTAEFQQFADGWLAKDGKPDFPCGEESLPSNFGKWKASAPARTETVRIPHPNVEGAFMNVTREVSSGSR